METDERKKKFTRYEIAGWIFVGIGILNGLIFTGFLIKDGYIKLGEKIILEGAEQVGSFIGGTSGACWALAGVFFFIAALKLQREDLNLQREDSALQRKIMEEAKVEAELTRKIMEKQYQNLEQQKEAFQQQTFETTFFNLLGKIERGRTKDNNKNFRALEEWVLEHIVGIKEVTVNRSLQYPDACVADFTLRKKNAKDINSPQNKPKIQEYLKNSLEKIRTDIRNKGGHAQIVINQEAIQLYDLFFIILVLIEENDRKADLYIKILLSTLLLGEKQHIFYLAYLYDPQYVEQIKRMKIPLDDICFFSAEHGTYFKN